MCEVLIFMFIMLEMMISVFLTMCSEVMVSVWKSELFGVLIRFSLCFCYS